MIKIANTKFDFYDDHDYTLLTTLPEDLLSCKVASEEELEELDDASFGAVFVQADGNKIRKYALHDEDARMLSAAYFETVKETLHPEMVVKIAAKIAKPNSPPNFIDLNYLQPATKTAEATEKHYGIEVDGQPYFPLHTAPHVKHAIAKFAEQEGILDFKQRYVLAKNIEKRAGDVCVKIPADSHINWYTNDKVNENSLARAVEIRKQGAARPCPELDVVVASKNTLNIVETLAGFDKVAGLGKYQYLRGIPDPFAACFLKAASPKLPSYTIEVTKLAEYFEPDFINAYVSNPEAVLGVVPVSVKEWLKKAAEENAFAKVIKDNEEESKYERQQNYNGTGTCPASAMLNPSLSMG